MKNELLDNGTLQNGLPAMSYERTDWDASRRREGILLDLMESMSSSTGSRFLKTLVCRLAGVLQVRYAYISECRPEDPYDVQVISLWTGKDFGENFGYSTFNTPCETVMQGRAAVYADKVQKHFPLDKVLEEWDAQSYAGVPIFDRVGQVIGHLAVLDDKPMEDEAFVLKIMTILAQQVATEMRRRKDEIILKEQIRFYRNTEAELKKKKEDLEKVNAITTSINGELNIKDLLQVVLEQTKFIQGVEKTTAILLDKSTGTFRLTASTDREISKEAHIELTPDECYRRYVSDNEEVYEDIFVVRQIKGRAAEHKLIHLGLPASLLVMRIRIREEVNGYLIFNNMRDPHAFDHQDIYLLSLLKTHIHSAIIKIRMLEELKELNEKKNEFLGMAAHDLRSPLQAMTGYLSMMADDLRRNRLERESAIEDMERIKASAAAMNRMIGDLLDITAIESGNITLNPEPSDLRDVLMGCLDLHRRHAFQKQIRMYVEDGETFTKVLVDRMRIAEVIENLLSNAIKYTRPEGSIRISFSNSDDKVWMHIRDSGLGLDENDMKQLFHGFRKLSARPTGGESSTGLGLLIVKKIVEKHGGSVHVTSKKGEGSTFSFSLPVWKTR